MRLLHTPGVVTGTFDDPNLVSRAGLEPVMRLAEQADLHEIAFTHGHVQQLHSAARALLAGLVGRTRGRLLAGAEQVCFVDIDSMLRRVYGKAKQGVVGFGHAKVGTARPDQRQHQLPSMRAVIDRWI